MPGTVFVSEHTALKKTKIPALDLYYRVKKTISIISIKIV